MSLQTRRNDFFLTCALLLSACGARSTNDYGLEETAGFLLVGERLTGLRIEIDGSYNKTISGDDTTRTLGTWTARRNKDEKMQRALIEAEPGRHDLKGGGLGPRSLSHTSCRPRGNHNRVSVWSERSAD